MQPLSEHLAQLSAEAKKAEERVSKAQAENKERLAQRREDLRRETEAALDKVSETVSRAAEGTRSHFEQLKSKVDSDIESMRQDASAQKGAFEAWQADNVANDRTDEAVGAIAYAIASVKIAESATLDALEARGRAEIKAAQTHPIEG